MNKYSVISSAIINIISLTTKLILAIVAIRQHIKIHNCIKASSKCRAF